MYITLLTLSCAKPNTSNFSIFLGKSNLNLVILTYLKSIFPSQLFNGIEGLLQILEMLQFSRKCCAYFFNGKSEV